MNLEGLLSLILISIKTFSLPNVNHPFNLIQFNVSLETLQKAVGAD